VKHTIVALLQDHPGVLTRAVSLFRRRGFNIESLAVGRSETRGVSRMTLVVEAEDVEQVVKQLYRLVEVLKVSDVTNEATVEREVALIKVDAPAARRTEISALVHMFGARVVDVSPTTMIVEATATPAKLESFLELLRPFGLKELARTGRIAMLRGPSAQRVELEEAAAVRAVGR
jgi:acetolactate synthase-1/3 small subunit